MVAGRKVGGSVPVPGVFHRELMRDPRHPVNHALRVERFLPYGYGPGFLRRYFMRKKEEGERVMERGDMLRG